MRMGNRQQARGNSKIQTKSIYFSTLVLFCAVCSSVQAQQTKKIPRIGYLSARGTPNLPAEQMLREAEPAAKAFRVDLHYLDVASPKNIESIFDEVHKRRADAVLVLASPILESHRMRVADLAAKNRLPTMFWASENVEVGD
jgi:hypothetical protein